MKHLFTAILLLATTTASADDRPNILFCIADDASFPHMGAYGCSWVKTPGFDRVAREGILFTNAYTPNAKCSPSRACILTGRNSWQLEEAANHIPFFPNKFRTYVEALRDKDYFCGWTGKGWSPGVVGKGRQITGKLYSKNTLKPPARAISNKDYAANFKEFLNDKPKGKPFCFWYGSHEPHRAYEYGAGVKYGGKKTSDIDKVPDFWPDNETVRNDMLDYAFEIEHFDKHLVRIIDMLEKRGELDNTLILVTTDNGMPFPRVKGQEYELSNHLPLAAMWKRGIKNPGRVVDDYVSFIDFAPTFIEVAGVKYADTNMQSSPGRSLTDIFNSTKAGTVNPARDHVLIGKERHDIGRPNDWGYPIRGIVKNGMLYLRNYEPTRWPAGNPETGYLNTDGSPTKTVVLQGRTQQKLSHFWQSNFGKRAPEEMFNVKTDRSCVTDLSGNTDFEKLKKELSEQMVRELKAQKDPRMFGNGHIFDEYEYANKGTRNYYERYMKGGKKLRAGWVNKSDYEKEPLD